MQRRHPSRHRGGFTLIELLVVIGIILLLISILMPVVSRVRLAAYDASTQSQMQRIMQACESYYHDWNSYPGPIANVNLAGGSNPITASTMISNVQGGAGYITSSENLVLGLLGFLNPITSNNPTSIMLVQSPNLPHDVVSLANRKSTGATNVATYHYMDYVPSELTTDFETSLQNEQGLQSTDTNIPEFIDRFPKPLPILYMRAFVGGNGVPAVYSADLSSGAYVQYNYAELAPYGCNIPLSNGTGSSQLLTATYFSTTMTGYTSGTANPGLDDSVQTPFTDYNGMTQVANSSPATYDGWLTNPNIAGVSPQSTNGGAPRGKDGFILISAGKDRVYGTHDDTIITP